MLDRDMFGNQKLTLLLSHWCKSLKRTLRNLFGDLILDPSRASLYRTNMPNNLPDYSALKKKASITLSERCFKQAPLR